MDTIHLTMDDVQQLLDRNLYMSSIWISETETHMWYIVSFTESLPPVYYPTPKLAFQALNL